jgi:hypothetical protein
MILLKFTPEGWEDLEIVRYALSKVQRYRMNLRGTLQRIIDEVRISILALPYHESLGEVDSADDLAAMNKYVEVCIL